MKERITSAVNAPCATPEEQLTHDSLKRFDALCAEGHGKMCAARQVYDGTGCVCEGEPEEESQAAQDEPTGERTMCEAELAFYLSGALAFIADVKGHEVKKREMERAGEYTRTDADLKKLKRLKEIEGLLVKVTDLYLPEEGWNPEDLKRADQAIDVINGTIKGLFA